MKKVKLSLNMWKKIVRKLRECMRANRALNGQIDAYNEKFSDFIKDKR